MIARRLSVDYSTSLFNGDKIIISNLSIHINKYQYQIIVNNNRIGMERKYVCINDLKELAKRRLRPGDFNYIELGAEDEITKHRN